jgi:PleD family two-component response regulator
MPAQILIIDDDLAMIAQIQPALEAAGYVVTVALTGEAGLQLICQAKPSLVLLEMDLPDMKGADLFRQLRVWTHTRGLPVIFHTHRPESLGIIQLVDDYMQKTVPMEYLLNRIKNVLHVQDHVVRLDPISHLPTGHFIEEHLGMLLKHTRPFVYIDLKINHFMDFTEGYGWQAGDKVLRFTAMLLNEQVELYGTPADYIGHPARDNFILITHVADAAPLLAAIQSTFAAQVQQHYSLIDRQRGYMVLVENGVEKPIALMTLISGWVDTRTRTFQDVRELTEQASDQRRGKASPPMTREDEILTSW